MIDRIRELDRNLGNDERALEEALKESFPASDPASITQPARGKKRPVTRRPAEDDDAGDRETDTE